LYAHCRDRVSLGEDRQAKADLCVVIVIIFRVSGAGRTTVGKLLARELGWHFLEADDFHPAGNVEKMRGGSSSDR